MKSLQEPDLGRRYLEFLDWPEVCAELASRAHSTRGVAACQALPLSGSPAEARERMAEVSEAVAVLRAGESLPALGFPEIEVHLRAVAQGMPLGPEELRQVADFCEVVANARRFFGRIQPEGGPHVPRLSRLAAQLGYHEDLVRLARETFDATGEQYRRHVGIEPGCPESGRKSTLGWGAGGGRGLRSLRLSRRWPSVRDLSFGNTGPVRHPSIVLNPVVPRPGSAAPWSL